MKWEIGDVVYLMSGGPPMTVRNPLSEAGLTYCCWFQGETLRHGAFYQETLTRERPEVCECQVQPQGVTHGQAS